MLISTIAAMALGQSLTDEVRLLRYPDVHGDQVVFVYASDLWISSTSGGVARRLTSHPGLESNPKFSPDGKWIAFNAAYDGSNDVFVIPSTGGEPRRLTYEPTSEVVKEWTPDGKRIAYVSSYGNFTTRMPRLWFVSVEGGIAERTEIAEAYDVSFNSDGSKMAYNRKLSHLFNWRRYRGGTQGKVSFWDFKTKSYSELPIGLENNYFPMWVGDNVYFLSDKNQSNINLYVYNTGNKRTEQLTQFTDGDIRWPSTDGKTIVFERNLRLHTFDLATKQIKTLDPRVTGDNISMRPRYMNLSNQVSNYALSPTAKRLIVEARGDIFSVPATSGETRNLTETDNAREQNASWSDDGKYIYYMTDKSGEQQIVRQNQMGGDEEAISTPSSHKIASYSLAPGSQKLYYTTVDFELFVMDVAGGTPKLVYKDMASPPSANWSADGKWLTYSKNMPNLQTSICLYELATGKEHAVTRGFFGDASPSFDQNGKYLYFISGRDYAPNQGVLGPHLEQSGIQRAYLVTLAKSTPNPMRPEEDEEPIEGQDSGANAPAGEMVVDIDGIEGRMLALPYAPGSFFGIIGLRNSALVVSQEGLSIYNIRTRQPAPMMPLPQGLAFNKDMTKMAYKIGNTIAITDVRPGVQVGAGAVNLSRVGKMVDPSIENKQMFWDVWRYERDQFYDPQMLGLNWKAIGDRYAKMLPYVGDRSDLDYIIGQLIGELGTGHSYVTPGPAGSDPMSPAAGLLGADYAVVGNNVKFAKIYRGVNYVPNSVGPLGAIGVDIKDGEYLLAVDGKPVTAKTGVTEHLIGKVGRKVELTVNDSPSNVGARKVSVYPAIDESNLRYETWVEERRQMVEQMSGGKIGYIHVPDTNVQGMIMFIRGYMAQMDKQAWVIDERYNGGGWIPTFFINYLQAQVTNVIAPRHGADVGLQPSLNGPKAMLINEHAGSGGDLFPYLFKKAGVGPLIGKRTWGGLVGIQGTYGLIGGGGVTSPAFGIYDPDTGKWIAENTGVAPDIEVEDDPALAAKGQDPQLSKAVEYLQNELKKGSKTYKTPDKPKVGGN
ncbi:MAG: PD40 domain-containing protein [Fimbriimonadaceae bacterium]|nr:PD40 domain-containing protein [Fimbriimonadaceae bacterium]